MGEIVILFIGYLPKDMDAEWLSQIFKSVGNVVDSFIPNKRSYFHNDIYGFIRFEHNGERFNNHHINEQYENMGHKILVKNRDLGIFKRRMRYLQVIKKHDSGGQIYK